ncbi:hypothetical protein FIM02_01355 [SAR202 cluster bacterium AD-802-E10_MRT_200m]|nr:hypothetical protein [SAR202 cluster bacterium AD-802-E10_MRT_200m]MQF82792.1 hypothetical protein [SAR202 cluster bacterium AD-802-E10_MRT_200m]
MNILFWILWIELLGLLGFLLTHPLLTKLQDHGYGFSKLLGLSLVSFFIWFLGSINILSFTKLSILLVIGLLVAIAVQINWKDRWNLRSFVRQEFRLLVITECLFLLLLAFWLIFRSLEPMINHTEQLMDFALLNASVNSTSLPPEDPWLRGHEISYYYMGHLMTALLTKLTGIPSAITYNLSLAFFSSMAFVSAFSLTVTLVGCLRASRQQAMLFGLLGGSILSIMGNLEGILELMHVRGVGSTGFWTGIAIKGLNSPVFNLSWIPTDDWWWWRATRVIDTLGENGSSLDYTIQEFPFFSSMLGDLHSHFMSTPFFVCTIGLIFNFVKDKQYVTEHWTKQYICRILLTGLMIGTVGFIDISTIPILLTLAFATITLDIFPGGLTRGKVHTIILTSTALIALTTLPFLLHYLKLDTQIDGLDIVVQPITQPLHFGIIWGGFAIILIQYFVFQMTQIPKHPSPIHSALGISLAVTPYTIWSIIAIFQGYTDLIIMRFLHVAPAVFILVVLIYQSLQIAKTRRNTEQLFVIVLLIIATFLLMFPELFYVRDHFSNSSPRMNTVFKTYYHSWVLLSLASGLVIFNGLKLLSQTRQWIQLINYTWLIVLIITLFAGLYYPISVSWGKLQRAIPSPTLDGLAFLKPYSLGEYMGIQWLLKHSQEGDGILEAVGNDYTDFGRVSASTGLPSILGWPGHEYQWRGSFVHLEGRAEAVETLYSSADTEKLVSLIRQYDIQYLILGPRERSTYQIEPPIITSGLLKRVFSYEGFEIYQFKIDFTIY